MISTLARSDRSLLALSLAFFAVAGVTNTTVTASYQTLVAVTVAVAGVYGLATYARTVDRRTLALVSLGLWLTFLAVAAFHLVGVAAIAGALSVSVSTASPVLTAATWATLMGASASSAFLGLREYGAQAGADAPEDRLLEQDLDL
ncbi:hypothetical protein [Natronobiforma cellulositropha]|uniref:hypothetical protein n=1 Tax=Natronobiforma cellulositropha TaxID=1679076 RepID=UPI0021D5EBE7|nr:hypothetical protein [Natronobiforma cellulositropha]